MKRIFAAFACALFVMAMLSLCTSAALPIYDFENGEVQSWSASDNVREVFADSHSPLVDEAPRNCLMVSSRALDVHLARGVEVDFPEHLDLSDYRTFGFEIYAAPYTRDPYAAFSVQVILTSGDGSRTEKTLPINAGQWSSTGVDIGNWNGRRDIVSAKFSLIITSTVDGTYSSSFYLDNVVADDQIVEKLAGRFMFDRFTVYGGNAYMSDTLLEIVPSEAEATTLTAALSTPLIAHQTDSLRLNIRSEGVRSLTVNYSIIENNTLSKTESTVLRLDESEEFRSYYIDIGDISALRTLEFVLPESNGAVEISSISAVSTFKPEQLNVCGSLTSCTITDNADMIRFTGEVNRDEALSNQNGTICIYAIGSGFGFDESTLRSSSALIESPMTTKFDLTVPLDSTKALHSSRFVILSRRVDGSISPISYPFYVENPEKLASSSEDAAFGNKGLVSPDVSLCGSLEADVTILELDVNDAFGSRLYGTPRQYNGSQYYFNSQILDKLDSKITALHGGGINVLIRITGWSKSFADDLRLAYSTEGIDYSSFNSTPDGNDYLAALTDYLAERFFVDGRADGVILGSALNYMNHEDGTDSLTSLAMSIAVDLRTVYNEIAAVNESARVYLSISDALSVELASESSEVGADQLLPAICELIRLQGSFDWGISIEQLARVESAGETLISPSDNDALIRILRSSGVYDTRLIFCDYIFELPKQRFSDMLSRMLYNYYLTIFSSHIDSYFICLSADTMTDSLAQMVRTVDTYDAENDPGVIANLVLSSMKIDSWKALIPNFDSRRVNYKRIELGEAKAEKPENVKGSYAYYSYDSLTPDSLFVGSYYCSSITIDSPSSDQSGVPAAIDSQLPAQSGQTGAKLRAMLDCELYGEGSAAYMGIVHRFEFPESFKPTPVLEFELGIEQVMPAELESVDAIISFTSEYSRYDVSAVLIPGQMNKYYVKVSGFSGVDDITGISILIDGEQVKTAQLVLGGITGLSFEYNDSSLEAVIAEKRADKRETDDSEKYVNYLWIGGGAIVTVATVMTVVLLHRRMEDDDEAE